MEVWKKYDDTYLVSNYGKIKNTKTGNILNGGKCEDGYIRVKIHGKFKKLHRIVAYVFVYNDDPENKIQVNHRDEDKENNYVDNLEWCDSKYNINYGSRNERAGKKISEKLTGVYNTKHSKQVLQYTKNGEFIAEYPSICEINRIYGFDISYICKCCNGKKNNAYGYVWKYK